MTNYDVVKKLIGPVMPVGESHIDEERYKNLNEMIELVDKLLFDIGQVALNKGRFEHSMSKAGKCAADFIEATKCS